MTKILISKPADLRRLARELLTLRPNIIAVEGPLGAGKTTLTKAIAGELGIKDVVVSPTFVLHREYPGLDHIDAWRVEDFEEIEKLGLSEMLANKHLVIIEWADKFQAQISKLKSQNKIVWVKLEYGERPNERRVSYENIGS